MDIAIVGAGLAGLSAAYDLVRAGLRPTVFDAAAEPGGQIRTRRVRGFLIEDGAEGFAAADQTVPALCRELGITGQIIPQLQTRALIYRGGVLSDLPQREAATLVGIPTPESGPPGISTLHEGMGTLITALVGAIRGTADLRLSHPAREITRHDGRWQMAFSDGRSEFADALILAVTPPAAADLLATHDPETATLLNAIAMHSNLSVSLAFARAHVAHSLAASGLVVAPGEQAVNGLRACVFSSSKFAGRAPASAALLRAFFRPGKDQLQDPDRDWVNRATDILARILRISSRPAGYWVSRWPDAIPDVAEDQQKLLSRLALRVPGSGRVVLAGSAYGPGGIPGAVLSGRGAAEQLTKSLPA